MILSIDPGTNKSGYVICDNEYNLLAHNIISNDLIFTLDVNKNDIVLIEYLDSVHGTIGSTTIDTIFFAGRFFQHFKTKTFFTELIGRKEVLKSLQCKNDSEIRKKIKENKKIKLSSHSWQAYSLIYYHEQNRNSIS